MSYYDAESEDFIDYDPSTEPEELAEKDFNPHEDGCYDEHGYFFDYGLPDSDPYD